MNIKSFLEKDNTLSLSTLTKKSSFFIRRNFYRFILDLTDVRKKLMRAHGCDFFSLNKFSKKLFYALRSVN